MANSQLESLCTTMVDSLLASGERHTLCLNLAAPDFDASAFVSNLLATRGKTNVRVEKEPSDHAFRQLTDALGGSVAIVEFEDLDHHPNSIETLLHHVKKEKPGGKLVVVSRNWNSNNTDRERELRKYCLFYQQSVAPAPKSTKPH